MLLLQSGGITGAYRTRISKARPVLMQALRQRQILIECINRSQILVNMHDIDQKFEETFHFFKVPQIIKGAQRKEGVSQPAEAIVPVAFATKGLGHAGGGRSEDGAGVFITME